MARAKEQNKHLWKHNKTCVWYYQRTYKNCRYKYSLYTKDINLARTLRNRYDLELAVNGTITFPSEMHSEVPSFGQVCTDWYEIKKDTCRQDSIKDGYKPKLNAHILLAPFVNKPINSIEAYDIEKWHRTISCAGNTVNAILDMVSSIFELAMKEKWVSTNPVKFVDRPRRNSHRPDPFSIGGMQILLKNYDDYYLDYQIVRFCAGMRSSEQNALHPSEHIDLSNRLILVRRCIVDGVIYPPKTESSIREIRMNEPTYHAITRQIKRAKRQGSQFLFFNKKGRPINTRVYGRDVWNPLFEKKGVKDLVKYRHCRCSRHTYISHSLLAGENPLYVATQVGHKDASIIFKHYAAYIKNDYDGSKLDKKLTQSLHNIGFGQSD